MLIGMDNPLDKAIELAGGTQAALAAKYGIKAQAVQQWPFIPEARALETERLFKGEISALDVLRYAEKARRVAARNPEKRAAA